MTVLKVVCALKKIASTDGKRILVDRIWPRGVSKEKIEISNWAKEIAPSTEIRKAFNHQSEKFQWFKKRYLQELSQNPESVDFFDNVKKYLKTENVTLIYGAKDQQYNHAVILQEFILENLKEKN